MAANPNTLSASFPAYWSRRMQRKMYNTDRYRMIASFEEQGTLKKGTVVHRPYRSDLTVNTLGADGGYTRQALTDTDQYLTVDTEKEISFYVRKIDEMQSNYETANEYADEAAVRLSNWIDGDVLGEYDNATGDIDDGDLGGTAGNGLTLTTSNIISLFGKIGKDLDSRNVPLEGRWGLISPQFYDTLWQYIAGKESLLGDNSGQNGHVGKYGGFDLYKSNACGWSAKLLMGTTPTDGDTVVINGVTFTAETSDASDAAGKFKAETSGTVSAGHLADAINNTNGYAASVGAAGTYTEVTAANRVLLKGIVATAGTLLMTLKAEGLSYVAVSETLTAAADVWTPALQVQHNLFGQGKPIDLVIQKYPNMEIKDRDGYIGKDVVTWTVYGLKTFAEGAKKLVDVNIRSDAF